MRAAIEGLLKGLAIGVFLAFIVILAVLTTLVGNKNYRSSSEDSLRTVYASVTGRSYVDDQWNVEFTTEDGETWFVEDYATNLGNTVYCLEFDTMGTADLLDDEITRITQITNMK